MLNIDIDLKIFECVNCLLVKWNLCVLGYWNLFFLFWWVLRFGLLRVIGGEVCNNFGLVLKLLYENYKWWKDLYKYVCLNKKNLLEIIWGCNVLFSVKKK